MPLIKLRLRSANRSPDFNNNLRNKIVGQQIAKPVLRS